MNKILSTGHELLEHRKSCVRVIKLTYDYIRNGTTHRRRLREVEIPVRFRVYITMGDGLVTQALDPELLVRYVYGSSH